MSACPTPWSCYCKCATCSKSPPSHNAHQFCNHNSGCHMGCN